MKIICVLFLALCTWVNSTSQEVGFLDLTNGAPTARRHQPRLSSGGGGMTIASDAAAIHEDRTLQITLLPLGRDAFQPGEEMVYVVQIQNTGTHARTIPWDPDITDVEPATPPQQYRYRQASVSLWFTNEAKLTEASEVSVLYGDPERGASTLQLEPGQSARLRAKTHLFFRDQDFALCAPGCKISARAVLALSDVTVTRQDGDYYEEVRPDGPPRASTNERSFSLVNSSQTRTLPQ